MLYPAEHRSPKTRNAESGSEEVGAYRDFDIDFAQLVAGQIAVAVEAQFQREQIARERDRSQLLLQVNNSLVSNLNLRELLSAISLALSPVMPHESRGADALRRAGNGALAAFDFPEDDGNCVTGKVVPFEGNPVGEAFTTRKTVLIDYSQSDDPRVACSGFVSGCASPLIFHDRALGVLAIKTRREHAFSAKMRSCWARSRIKSRSRSRMRSRTTKSKPQEQARRRKLYLEEEIRLGIQLPGDHRIQLRLEARVAERRDSRDHWLNRLDLRRNRNRQG